MNELHDFVLFAIYALFFITTFKYVIYLVTSIYYRKSVKKHLDPVSDFTRKEIETKMKLSVIVPAWNEQVGILNSVKSILNSTYKNIEIIVVNDGSTDNTDSVLKEYINKNEAPIETGINIRYFHKENGGKGDALNYGIKRSTGDVIVTMDADTAFEPDALYQVALYFMNPNLDAAVGNVKIANSKSLLGIIQQIEYIVGFYFKRTHSIFNSEYIIGGAFGVFRSEVFKKYGYFDTSIKTEDIELSTRLQFHGCNIMFIEDAIAYTEGPATLTGLLKQRLRWKKGRLDTFYKHRDLFFSTKKHHSKFLTMFLLPITVFYEIELFFEPLFTLFGVYYLYSTGNYFPLVIWVTFTGFIYLFTFFFGSRKNSRVAFAFLPFYFLLSYILTFVEVYSMYASVKLILQKRDVAWQTWNRRGLTNV